MVVDKALENLANEFAFETFPLKLVVEYGKPLLVGLIVEQIFQGPVDLFDCDVLAGHLTF